MTTLSNIFSREKTLFYFAMWNDSDRMGYEDYLGYTVKNNLFIVPPVGEKGSVWYSQDELGEIDARLNQKVLTKEFEDRIVERLNAYWPKLLPYLKDGKGVQTPDELAEYYKDLITWWSAMNTVFTVPDKENIPQEFKRKVLKYRAESEKYTERMNKVFVEYWKKSTYPDLTNVLMPEEAIRIASNQASAEEIESYKERLNGCFMLNRSVHLMMELEPKLRATGVELEKVALTETMEIKGRPAYKGTVEGMVRIIKVMADTHKITQGDILVTEMTNPDYVPYMKMAGAVVTDEGGATCHAAIASRELKVPCVVGTRIATKVLRDGQKVRVEGEKGIVTLLQ